MSDAEWEFCEPYLTLMSEAAPQREYELRGGIFNALRWFMRAGCPWRMIPMIYPMEHCSSAGLTLGHLLALQITPANEQDRAQVIALVRQHQEVTKGSVQVAFVNQDYTGASREAQAAEHSIDLQVAKHHEAKKGFTLLPSHWVVERSFGWAARFRRLSRDYEHLASNLAGYHWLACLLLKSAFSSS